MVSFSIIHASSVFCFFCKNLRSTQFSLPSTHRKHTRTQFRSNSDHRAQSWQQVVQKVKNASTARVYESKWRERHLHFPVTFSCCRYKITQQADVTSIASVAQVRLLAGCIPVNSQLGALAIRGTELRISADFVNIKHNTCGATVASVVRPLGTGRARIGKERRACIVYRSTAAVRRAVVRIVVEGGAPRLVKALIGAGFER